MTRTHSFLVVPILAVALVSCSDSDSDPVAISSTAPPSTASRSATPTTAAVSSTTSAEVAESNVASTADEDLLCGTMVDYFAGVRELEGSSYDPDQAAQEWMDFLRSAEAEANWDRSDGPAWSEMTASQRTNMERAVQAAASGDC